MLRPDPGYFLKEMLVACLDLTPVISLQSASVPAPVQDILEALMEPYLKSQNNQYSDKSFVKKHDVQKQIDQLSVSTGPNNEQPVAEWTYNKISNALDIKLKLYPPTDSLRAAKDAGIDPLVLKGTNVKNLLAVLIAAKDVGIEIQLDPKALDAINKDPGAPLQLQGAGIDLAVLQKTSKFTPPSPGGAQSTEPPGEATPSEPAKKPSAGGGP